jgi:hypothetical protein
VRFSAIAALLSTFTIPTCHKKVPPPPEPGALLVAAGVDEIREQALRDLQGDVLLLRTQLAVVSAVQLAPGKIATPGPAAKIDAALYTCDRVALASRALNGEARAQSLLGDADTLCGYQVPLAASQRRLVALEAMPVAGTRAATADCGPIRDAIARVSVKYRTDEQVADLLRRFKAACPHVRLSGHPDRVNASSSSSSSSSSAPRGPDPSECRRRCDDTAFSCRGSCQYCGSCTSDKTWDWCHATCNSCRSSCEQNEKFCRASCGG